MRWRWQVKVGLTILVLVGIHHMQPLPLLMIADNELFTLLIFGVRFTPSCLSIVFLSFGSSSRAFRDRFHSFYDPFCICLLDTHQLQLFTF
jgi:hypothetical protein